MKCPVCKTPDLLMTERQGVEIDYCPTCRGIWLDRGELDKLLNQIEVPEPQRSSGNEQRDARYDDRDSRRDQEWGRRGDAYHDDHRKQTYDPRRKKKSLFDMFDFD
ncbi:zf-TFIIB domain-containing protein [Paraburkholderia sp. C35]|uniref:TFIIB-type zinc ribbon-containing protein n=1 Tax=Paraburkholderia sp. C35 TaxID=2126993 RepID=UPI000D69C4F8|nr:zf-TFIIB domain-containing protein [Paraburkholderia sp. C35]